MLPQAPVELALLHEVVHTGSILVGHVPALEEFLRCHVLVPEPDVMGAGHDLSPLLLRIHDAPVQGLISARPARHDVMRAAPRLLGRAMEDLECVIVPVEDRVHVVLVKEGPHIGVHDRGHAEVPGAVDLVVEKHEHPLALPGVLLEVRLEPLHLVIHRRRFKPPRVVGVDDDEVGVGKIEREIRTFPGIDVRLVERGEEARVFNPGTRVVIPRGVHPGHIRDVWGCLPEEILPAALELARVDVIPDGHYERFLGPVDVKCLEDGGNVAMVGMHVPHDAKFKGVTDTRRDARPERVENLPVVPGDAVIIRGFGFESLQEKVMVPARGICLPREFLVTCIRFPILHPRVQGIVLGFPADAHLPTRVRAVSNIRAPLIEMLKASHSNHTE